MELITSKKSLISMKNSDLVKLKCENCRKIFNMGKKYVLRILNHKAGVTGNFCSKKCKGEFNTITNTKIVNCKQCNTKFRKLNSQIKKHPNNFCSQSCSAKYNNAHKTKGTRRSKLEQWIELKLKEFYPELEILFNSKEIIKSELDIYIPSLRLAFELNGIFHYEPIYGKDKFNKIQSNDTNKFQKCQKHNISLCILDTSKQLHFNEKTSIHFLNKIRESIFHRVAT